MGVNPMRGERVEDVMRSVADSVRARFEARPELADSFGQ